ncbi:MAG TPA: ABC transporter permease, partial [Candidatus Acidoferrales bacterium]|nr:ABC transporter permease [Candidatus Acidoferrales bacterium]
MPMRDFAFAARALRNSPVFAVTAIVTIALGIGASTAIFSVTNAVLLRPLPYKNPDRLIFACTDMKKRNVRDFPNSNANFIDLRDGATTMSEGYAAVQTFPNLTVRDDGTPEQIQLAIVSPNFFRLMGGKVVRGRDFQDDDGQPPPPPPPQGAPVNAPAPPAPPVAILSYEYWQRRFGGNPEVIGSVMKTAGGGGPLIVGVLEPGFGLLAPPNLALQRFPNVWQVARIAYDAANRKQVQWQMVGRLKPGVSIEQAQAEADTVAARIVKIDPIFSTAGYAIRLEPMKRYLTAEVRPAILALMGAVIFLLLIACANVANLLLVRASLRERELAVRTALGGSRWRLVRQMLAEALLLSGFGTVLGLGLAWLGIRELLAIAPANLPRLDSVTIDPQVVGFSALAGLVAAGLFGIVPALRASRPDVMQTLRSTGRTAGLGAGRFLRGGVVVAEVALSFVLLIGSGLMFRSFLALQHIDAGYDPHGLLTFNLFGVFQGPKQTPEQRAAIQRQIQEQLRALPGVENAAASFPLPLSDGWSPIRWGLEPALTDPSKFQAADVVFVTPGYFEAMRTGLVDGRTFTEADNTKDRNYVVIDDALAAKAFPHESAVGKRILIRVRTPEPEWVEIIGVVRHERGTSLAEPGREQVYFVDAFVGYGAAGIWEVRTAADPGGLSGPVRAAIAKIDPHMLTTQMQPMSVLVEKAQSGTRFSLLLIGVFAVVAALLAGVGLYGVLSTVVRERTAEIGVRMAIGALPTDIFRLMVGYVARLTATGIVLGLAAALFLTRTMTSMLVGVKAADPATYAAMVGLFFVIAGLASWLPARRAAGL